MRDHRLLRDGRIVPLTPKVFAVLRVLVENSGHLVEKDDLLKQVWPDSFVEEGALNRAVSVLRKALDDNPPGQKYIETVPKRGYRFVGQVTSSDDDEVLSRGDGSPAAGKPRVTRSLAIAAAVIALVLVGGIWFGLSKRADGESSARVPARARAPAGDVHGTGRRADRLTGRQADRLRLATTNPRRN